MEVAFDRANVTSVGWLSYPILDITEAPEAVDIVLINRLDRAPADVGRAGSAPSPAPSPTRSSAPSACAGAGLR